MQNSARLAWSLSALPGLAIAVLLIGSLLLVHFSVRAQPLPIRRPLDVDRRLPLPEVGQASTVFSLTALFGAYLGIYLILGIPAFAGIACGTVVSLFVIRSWIRYHQTLTFEDFLLSILAGGIRNASAFALMVAAVQCAYATSELLLLREISKLLLGLSSDYATLLAVATGLIGYFYVLFGGYLAIYRTDILQLMLVGIMAVAFAVQFMESDFLSSPASSIWPRPGYWEIPLFGSASEYLKYLFHFIVGAVMGFGLLAAAPDAWKRVFVVTVLRENTLLRFAAFVGVGVAPFIMLLPLAAATPPIPNGPFNTGQMFSGLLANETLFVAAALGLIASFLSAFNSAFLASVHVTLILQRKLHNIDSETGRFHWLMTTMLITIFCLFEGLLSFENPYLLANLLLGPYAVVAGMQAGTKAMPARLVEGSVLWIGVLGFVSWFLYVSYTIGLPKAPTTYEVNTVVGGVGLFLVVAFICRILSMVSPKDA